MRAHALLLVFCRAAAISDDVVTTKQGDVKGVVTSAGTRQWRGIPFAQPPTGKLRWQSPQPPAAWAPDVKDASEFGHNCLQSGNSFDMGWPQPRSTLSEDCLFLNVYSGPADKTKSAPVLVWIYGGGFQGGGGNETRLNGTWDVELREELGATSSLTPRERDFIAAESITTAPRRVPERLDDGLSEVVADAALRHVEPRTLRQLKLVSRPWRERARRELRKRSRRGGERALWEAFRAEQTRMWMGESPISTRS